MKPLLERLKAREVLVADGAMGTLLIDRGLEPGQAPETVNLAHPETLEDIARQYLEAGADIIQTNTFGGSPMKLAASGLAAEAAGINRSAVQAVRRAVGDRAYVCGSCGPCGKLPKPYGDAEPDDIYRSFRTQMEALVGGGVDVICVETMIDLTEAARAVNAAKDVSPATPVMATMTFDATPRGFFTLMGVSIEQAAEGLLTAGADVVGSNCGNGIRNMVPIAAEFRKVCDAPIIVQPNAGLPVTVGGRVVYGETPEFMAEHARELLALGVAIIGGCCGTTPAHTRALRRVVDAFADKR